MKRFFIYLFLICSMFFSLEAFAIKEKSNIAVFSLDVPTNTSSYAIYSNSQNMFAADLVNSLKKYDDTNVIDIYSSEKAIENANLRSKYQKMIKEYKQKYTIDYEKADEIANALGVNYLVFVYGGFDMEKSFLKPNWKYRWQWIWANPVKSSAQININTTLIDVKNRTYILEENIKKDISMDNFNTPSQGFGENVVPIGEIKNFTKQNAPEIAKKIHNVIYPNPTEKVSEKNIFIDKFTPNFWKDKKATEKVTQTETIPTNNEYSQTEQQMPEPEPMYTESQEQTNQSSVLDARKENYKNYIQEKI